MAGLATDTIVVSTRIMKNPMMRAQSAGQGLRALSRSVMGHAFPGAAGFAPRGEYAHFLNRTLRLSVVRNSVRCELFYIEHYFYHGRVGMALAQIESADQVAQITRLRTQIGQMQRRPATPE